MLSAGGMFAAWEIGVLEALRGYFTPDLIVGASAGSWNGWALAGGAPLEELEREWKDPRTAQLLRFHPHRWALCSPEPLRERALDLFQRFQPRVPFGLTTVEVPSLRLRLTTGAHISWRHLAAACSIPLCFPAVEIDGTRHVDGGLRGALPLWAAREMGATRAVALNCLTNWPLKMFRGILLPPGEGSLPVVRIEPERPLGSLREAVIWSRENTERWIAQGFADGIRARTSITM